MITVGNKTENLTFGEVEHFLGGIWRDERDTPRQILFLQITAILVSSLIFFLNGTIMKTIQMQEKKTFLDWMIVIDSCLCISSIIPLVMHVSDSPQGELVCFIKSGMMFFMSILNRVLSVMIALYRTIYALKPSFVDTKTKRKALNVILFGSLLILSVGTTLGLGMYRQKYRGFAGIHIIHKYNHFPIYLIFLVCMQDEHKFYYNVEDFYSKISRRNYFLLPNLHPFKITIIVCFFSGTILVPILYGRIYK